MKADEIGFSGTQIGMTKPQEISLAEILREHDPRRVHHGDCVGSDERFHNIVRGELPNCTIVIHPPTNNSKRAFCDGDEFRNRFPYLVRNHHIVEESVLLIATPKESEEVLRSGTWATYRYAAKINRPKLLILPDGSVV